MTKPARGFGVVFDSKKKTTKKQQPKRKNIKKKKEKKKEKSFGFVFGFSFSAVSFLFFSFSARQNPHLLARDWEISLNRLSKWDGEQAIKKKGEFLRDGNFEGKKNLINTHHQHQHSESRKNETNKQKHHK